MNRLAPAFRQERRSVFRVLGQCVAPGLALAGHISVALAMMPLWTTKPMVSTGSPPQAIYVDLILSSSVAGSTQASQLDLAATDDARAADNAVSASANEAAENAAAPSPADIVPNSVGHDMAAKTLQVKPVQLTKPARSKKASSRLARVDVRSEAPVSGLVQGDNGMDSPTIEPARQTFGYTTSVTDLPSAWKSRLLAHLERFKLYPETAQSRHEDGVSLLSFTLDRDGRVLSFFIVRSSGSDELDAAAQAMIERASPVPPVPEDVPGQMVQLVVPVRFTVR